MAGVDGEGRDSGLVLKQMTSVSTLPRHQLILLSPSERLCDCSDQMKAPRSCRSPGEKRNVLPKRLQEKEAGRRWRAVPRSAIGVAQPPSWKAGKTR